MASYGNLTVPAVAGTSTITPGTRLWLQRIVRSRIGFSVGGNTFVLSAAGFLVAATTPDTTTIAAHVHKNDIKSN